MKTQPTHGGNIWQCARETGISPCKILDFSANINPIGPPDCLRSIIRGQIENLVHYPDPSCSQLTGAIAGHFGIGPQQIVCGNGSSELLYALPHVLNVNRAVLPEPGYTDYARAARAAGIETVHILPEDVSSPSFAKKPCGPACNAERSTAGRLPHGRMASLASEGFAKMPCPDLFKSGPRGASLEISFKRLESELRGNEIVFIGQPNNPTGLLFDKAAFIKLAEARHDTFFVVDEAFADFIENYRSVIHHNLPNVLVLRSMTKFFAIPGLRLGALLGPADIIARIGKTLPFWSVNHLAQAAGAAFFADESYAVRTRQFVQKCRQELYRGLNAFPELFVYPGTANYLLVRMDHVQLDALMLQEKLLRKGIVIRVCDNFVGLDKRFFRVAVRKQEENERLCDAIAEVIGRKSKPCQRPSRTPALMLQGTSSWAGKSILTTAFCRILLQDGYRVAPFKAQNMSLNSFVTLDGGEIGRAQALQAQACRIEPDVRMNPVLLKPNSETGSQVIVMGKPVGNMSVDEYIRYKPVAFQAVCQAYDTLAEENEVIVIEGAGSPAEINLKHHDIVNMTMARYAAAPVLLVGDIDRGGVFASFVGTMELLDEWERAQVAGFVVNRFRGKEALLKEALDYTEQHTARPVFGVVPYLSDLNLPEEDSVTFKSRLTAEPAGKTAERVDIAVVDLPHISNFTDFDALKFEPDTEVRIIRTAAEVGRPDALILPGSKNVAGDLEWLKAKGFDAAVRSLAQSGRTEVIGICGGYQMLGNAISDPHKIESSGATFHGLGLLNLSTVMAPEKMLTRTRGTHLASTHKVHGYQIHHGQSADHCGQPLVRSDDGEIIGTVSGNGGLVWGTYLHGIFDADEFRRWFINKLRARRGLPELTGLQNTYDLEPALDRLADVVRRSLQISDIYRLIGLKSP